MSQDLNPEGKTLLRVQAPLIRGMAPTNQLTPPNLITSLRAALKCEFSQLSLGGTVTVKREVEKLTPRFNEASVIVINVSLCYHRENKMQCHFPKNSIYHQNIR